MKIQMPLADDVFLEWLKKADDKTVQKKFGFRKSDPIQTSENIASVTKSAAFYFRTEIASPLPKGAQKPELVSLRKLTSKKFFLFRKPVDLAAWPHKDMMVLLFDQLNSVQCKKCSGKGAFTCDKCSGKGAFPCDKCKGEAQVKCKACEGAGKRILEMDVLVDLKKEKRTLEVQCPHCFGGGSAPCSKCDGLGKIGCNKCKGSAAKPCSDCDGYGIFFQIASGSVPVAQGHNSRLFVNKAFEQISKNPAEFQRLLESQRVDSIQIKSPKDLKDDDIARMLLMPKLEGDIKNAMNQCQKAFDNMAKAFHKGKDAEQPIPPIEVFPLLRLDVKTLKGARFEIYAIGSAQGCVILDRGF
ncbi:MAG: hypothetical protein ACE5OZ_05625 [Candidatus Heimdallarchaeota archaeon]